jgi:hypothetical protein
MSCPHLGQLLMLLLLNNLRFMMSLEIYFTATSGAVKQPFIDLLLFHFSYYCSAY